MFASFHISLKEILFKMHLEQTEQNIQKLTLDEICTRRIS